ncbi:MAG: hypothetical protein ORN51_00720 [Akkermansiaceae bacterium]|nr:hypothetical protein [Akkermansiaceae bacterium]
MNPNDKTPLVIQPDSGIRLNLANYYRIRTWQGGGEFWEHNNQQLIRDALGQFLPRATVDSSNFVLFQHYEDGKEICSRSQPVTAANPLPRVQLDQLRSALTAFKAKTQDPKCDPEARKLIDCFRLPDPKKDPELYRIYGSGKNKRLVVLWGAEKEVDSAVPPLKAINMVHTEPLGVGKGNGKSMLFVGLLVLLAVLGLFFWQRDKGNKVVGGHGNSGGEAPLQEASAGTKEGSGGSFLAGANTEGRPSKTPVDGSSAGTIGGTSADEKSGIASTNGGAPSSNPISRDPVANPLQETSNSQGRPMTGTTADKGAEPGLATGSGSKSGDQTSRNNPGGQRSSDKASAVSGTGEPLQPSSEDPAAAGNTPPPMQPLVGGKGLDPQPGGKGDEPPTKKSDPDAPVGDISPESRTAAANNTDAPKPGTTTTAELTETKIRIKETSPFNPTAKPDAQPDAQPGVSAVLKPGELEIKAQVGEDLREGEVEVILGLRAQDANYKDIQMDRAIWLLDGIELKGQDGKPLSDPKVSHWLPVGKHALSVLGRTKDGKEMRGAAKLDVQIKQQPKPEVDIQNSPPSKDK